jgi:predicted ATPase/class 3 adenylate cyclase
MKTIPSGTVTFLFTDIEGSTDLWERYPEQMKSAFPRQEVILREAVTRHGGYIYKMIGDGFQVAFETAPSAVCAALEAQQQLQAESWGETPIRVRMALHTGVTEERGDDYVGPTLNRVGRLLNAGYGGQVLLTHATCELVWDDLPCGTSLRELGEYHFKDLVRSERIYQLEAADLPTHFPALKTLDAFPHNLPIQLTSFIGREMQMVGIKLLLVMDEARLVTLTGSGGTGKTRLALQVAADLLETFRDGVWLVELAPLADPALVPQTVAAAVGIRETPGKAITTVLSEYLRPRRLLLILDNCEHVTAACANLAGSLLQTCPDLWILATSREVLGVAGEIPYQIPSLSVPDVKQVLTLEQLTAYEAVRLFVERAAQASPSFILTEDNAPGIARICSRLDGIPLAIELAAARVRLLSADQIVTRLDDAFRLLTGGSRTVLPRHQTLQASIDWSFNLLSPPERSLLINLSVFAGGWTLEAAEEVCGQQDQVNQMDVLPLLAQLVDKSLVLAVQEDQADTRYRLLETIRQYARQKSSEIGGGVELHDRHLDYFLKLALEAEPHLRGAHQRTWLDRLEFELDNLRLALEWSLPSRAQDGLELSAALLWFWHIRGHGSEGITWLKRLLEAETSTRANQDAGTAQRLSLAKALNAAGFLIYMQIGYIQSQSYLKESVEIFRSLGAAGRQGLAKALLNLGSSAENAIQAEIMHQESLAISRQLGDKFVIAEGLQDLGGLWTEQGKFKEAQAALEEDLALRKELDDQDGIGTALLFLGNLAFYQGDFNRAQQLYEASQVCYRKVNNIEFIGRAFFNLSYLAAVQGDYEEATRLCGQVIALSQEPGFRTHMASAVNFLGYIAWSSGDYELAEKKAQDAMIVGQEIGNKGILFDSYYLLGRIALSQGNLAVAETYFVKLVEGRAYGYFPLGIKDNLAVRAMLSRRTGELERAVQLYSAAETICPWAVHVILPVDRRERQSDLVALRAELGEMTFSAAWAEGQKLACRLNQKGLSLAWKAMCRPTRPCLPISWQKESWLSLLALVNWKFYS